MRAVWRVYLVSALLACVVAAATAFVTVRLLVSATAQYPPSAQASPEQKAWEEKQVKTTADSFLHAVTSSSGPEAFGMLSKSYQERLPPEAQKSKSMLWWQKAQGQKGDFMLHIRRMTPTIETQEVSPLLDTAELSGSMRADLDCYRVFGALEKNEVWRYTFKLRLIQDREARAWKVESFTLQKEE
jgi:hypothetical protein